ncbi:MAG TPA: DNA internalization-related competence protein ComEC/Rec2 [Deltaproteobacteria bacterium]|nr:DNA internalization-related competence protein ComEC/Rec2 [Deltaproteobacteria bacterium]
MSGIYFRPVVPLLISLMVGIWTGCHFPGRWTAFWGFAVFGLGVLLFLIIRKRQGRIAPFLFFVALGYLSIQPWISPLFLPNHIVHFKDASVYTIEGTVAGKPIKEKARSRFILTAKAISDKDKFVPVTGRISVSIYGQDPGLSPGDTISFPSKIRSFRNFNNPGKFDYARHMSFRNIWGTAYTSGMRLTVLHKGNTNGIRQKIENFRSRISLWIDNQRSDSAKGVLKALVIGDRSQIASPVRSGFYRSGVGHILAISGLHIGIVATASFLFFKWIFTHIEILLWHAWTRKAAAIASLAPVILYGLLAGMSPSTQRAVIMVSLFLLSFLIEREHDTINTLSVAAFLILMVHPPSLFSASFQLSFGAVFFILFGFISFDKTPLMEQKTAGTSGIRFLFRIRSFFLASLFATLGTFPFVMYYFNQVSLIGLLANLVIIPIIGFIVVPLGLISVLLYSLGIPLADGCIHLSLTILQQAVYLVQWMSNFPYAAIQTFTPTTFEMIGYYLLILVLLLKREKQISLKTVRIAVSIIVFAGLTDFGYWVHHRFWHKDLVITAIDVGQGSAVLLELPGGKTFMVDGGGFSDNSAFDVGEKIIAPLLRLKKIGTIDTLILTHPDSDHINGLLYLADHFNVESIWTNGEGVQTGGYRRLMDIAEKNNIRFPAYEQIPKNHEINGVRLNILYPPENFLARREKERWRNLNNNSLVIQVRYGSTSFLFPGDIMKQAEKELIQQVGEGLKSTVLLAPHHGGRDSNTTPFIRTVSPEQVVVSSGWKNRFGFPHPAVMKAYKAHGSRVYNTATHGAITFRSDGKQLKIKSELKVKE